MSRLSTNINTRSNYDRLHLYYRKRAYAVIIKEFRKMIKSIDFTNIDYWNAFVTIAISVNEKSLYNAMLKMYIDVGLRYGRHVVRNLEAEKKSKKPYALFSEKYLEFIKKYMDDYGGEKITQTTDTMKKKIVGEIAKMQADGLTQSEMAKAIEILVNKPDFYRMNAIRIVRTETNFAMNAAKAVSFGTSDFKVNKVWIHGGSAAPRDGHVDMDGVEVEDGELFILPDGEKMLYPSDDTNGATAGNIINCSCTFGYSPQRDANGDLIYK